MCGERDSQAEIQLTQVHVGRIQTTTDLTRSLLCFNPIGAILSCTFWSVPTGTLITNSNFWQNTGKQKHSLYSLQPTVARNEYLF